MPVLLQIYYVSFMLRLLYTDHAENNQTQCKSLFLFQIGVNKHDYKW